MSYDLFFRPRSGEVTTAQFLDYFSARPHFRVEGSQAWYENEDSGVYFVFEPASASEEGEPNYPFTFNINFFRPSYFIHEAEPEVSALVRHFDFTVMDPQAEGMGEGEYRAEQLISGWHHGNEFGYSAVLANQDDRPELFSLPKDTLHRVWKWNLGRDSLQDGLEEDQFVPKVMFLQIDGETTTAAVWPDAIPIVLPQVDWLIVGREELAPRRFLRKEKDSVFVRWGDIGGLIQKHDSRKRPGAFDLCYVKPPSDLADFVRGLVAAKPNVVGLSADRVLDRELVEKYVN
jgi:hypothetical protein